MIQELVKWICCVGKQPFLHFLQVQPGMYDLTGRPRVGVAVCLAASIVQLFASGWLRIARFDS